MDKISIKEFDTDLKDKEYTSIYNRIFERTLDLINEIIKVRNIELNIPQNKEKVDLDYIHYVLERNTVFFKSTLELIDSLLLWESKTGYLNDKTPDEKINIYIDLFNCAMDELDYYKKIAKSIKDTGYEKVKEKCINNLIKLFKEMLEYKTTSYNDNWNLEEWLDHIDTHYHFYHEEILDTLRMVFSSFKYLEFTDDVEIEINEIEKIIQLKKLYLTLTEKDNDYKNYATYYREYKLKEGETYKDIQKKIEKKFINLFKEMLNYIGAEYEQDTDDFEYLQTLVENEYPFYFDTLTHLSVLKWDPNVTYIVLLNSMEDIYECLSKNYKNREELMKKYQKEQDFEWPEEDM